MSVFINNTPIATRIIKQLDNHALSAAHQFSLDANVPVYLEFKNAKDIPSYELVQDYIYMRAVADNNLCAHIWFHHPEYINSVNALNVLKFLQKYKYDITLLDDERVRLLISELPCPELTKENKVLCSVPMLVGYFEKMHIGKSQYVPIEHNYIDGISYTKNVYNIEPNTVYTYVYSYEDIVNAICRGTLRNIVIDFNTNRYISLADYNLGRYPTTEDLRTWRIGGNCTELRCLFMNYPCEIDPSNWQMSHLYFMCGVFQDTKLHPAVSDMKFLSCTNAQLCFSGSNIKKAPIFERLVNIDSMFHNCNSLVDVSGIKSKNNIAFIRNFCSLCPNLKNGLSDLVIESDAIYMTECVSLQEYLYKNCKFKYKINIDKIKKLYSHLPNIFKNCTFTKK